MVAFYEEHLLLKWSLETVVVSAVVIAPHYKLSGINVLYLVERCGHQPSRKKTAAAQEGLRNSYVPR